MGHAESTPTAVLPHRWGLVGPMSRSSLGTAEPLLLLLDLPSALLTAALAGCSLAFVVVTDTGGDEDGGDAVTRTARERWLGLGLGARRGDA